MKPISLFYLSRLYMAFLTLLIDYIVFVIAKTKCYGNEDSGSQRQQRLRTKLVLLLLASSQCIVVSHTRTFSNSFASVVLAGVLAIWCLFRDVQQTTAKVGGKSLQKNSQRIEQGWSNVGILAFMFGGLSVFGVFTHATFAMFVIPVGISFLITSYQYAKQLGSMTRFVSIISSCGAGSLLTASVLILLDSLYYGSMRLSSQYPFIKVTNNFNCIVIVKKEYIGNMNKCIVFRGHLRLSPYNNIKLTTLIWIT